MKSIYGRLGGLAALVALAACSGANAGFAPTSGGSAPQAAAAPSGSTIHVTSADALAALRVTNFTYHIMPLRTPAGGKTASTVIYPAQLTNYGGPKMKTERTVNIYVNCKAQDESCWGAPEEFQKALTGSKFAGILQQYTNTGPKSFTFERSANVAYAVYDRNVPENGLLQILHAVASTSSQAGYTTLYHIFLPKGTNTCFNASPVCYSPNNYSTFAFCAYHASVDFSDLGTVIYSVEPYQDVDGCATKKSSGASELTNSTISTLAHETFESISDPGPKLAWYNYQFGEMADICESYVSSLTLGKTVYNSQPMYSNKIHACTVAG